MVTLGALLLTFAAATPEPSALSYWSDGAAELDGYRTVRDRYGENRDATVVLIFVKEPFSETARVKADPGKHPDRDVFDVLKLNVMEKFQTGIYDYSLMTSAFAAFEPRAGRPAGALTKLTFTSQEWCGTLFEELLFDAAAIRQKRFSYFDGEADQVRDLPYPPDGITADQLPILVRSIPAPLLARGEERKIPFLPSLTETRLLHKELAWQDAKLSRSKDTRELKVPAGSFSVETWTLSRSDGQSQQLFVEAEHPRRLIGWKGPGTAEGSLTGTARLKYWELNHEGHEKHLAQLGLVPVGKRGL